MARSELNRLKGIMLEMDSLPPMSVDTPSAGADRTAARDILELGVFLAIKSEDSSAFQRGVSSVRPYYDLGASSENQNTILGLNLLYLLVENKLADFHSELEIA